MPWVHTDHPELRLACTPGNVADALRGFGYPVATRTTPGWRASWHGRHGQVKVAYPAAALPEVVTCGHLLQAAGWPVEHVPADRTGDEDGWQPGGYLLITGPRNPGGE